MAPLSPPAEFAGFADCPQETDFALKPHPNVSCTKALTPGWRKG
jgi:hypothetical protein